MAKRNQNNAPAITEVVSDTAIDFNASMLEAGIDLEALNAMVGDATAELETSAEALGAEEAARAEDEAILAALEAADKAEEPAEEEATEEVEAFIVDHVEGDMKEMLAEVSDEAALIMGLRVKDAFEGRAQAERVKNPDNDTIQKSLNKSRAKLTGSAAASVLVATAVDPDFINRSISNGSTYNVYAIDKFADIIAGISGGVMRNAINLAVMKSMFKFRAAGVEFTGEMARAAASAQIKVSAAQKALLTRHTVSPSTAPTQASSTMSALVTAGVVENRGSMKYPVYVLTDTPQTRALQEVLAA